MILLQAKKADTSTTHRIRFIALRALKSEPLNKPRIECKQVFNQCISG